MGMEMEYTKTAEGRRNKKDVVKSGILNAKIMATYRKCKKRAWTQRGEKGSDNELLC